MKSLFDKPQRQSSIGILVLFFDTLYQYGKAFGPLLFILVLQLSKISLWQLWMYVLGIVLLTSVVAFLKYLNFTFYLDHEKNEFIIQEGIFNKTNTTIQLYKIQQVNIKQNIIQRLINVYSLEVDTAGSNTREVEIKAISHELAVELKAALQHNEKGSEVEEVSDDGSPKTDKEVEPFLKISFLSLVKMGITSKYVRSFSLLLVFFFTVLDYVEKVFGEEFYDESTYSQLFNVERMIQSVFVMVMITLLLIVVINLSRMLIKYFDYTINQRKGSLLISYGLINTNHTILKPEKVQITAISQNYFQKKLNILGLSIKQAAQGDNDQRKSTIEIPGCNEAEKNSILQLIFKRIPEKGVTLNPNFRKLVFALFLTIMLPLSLYFVCRSYMPDFDYHYDYILPLYVIFVGAIQYFKFRNSKLYINDEFIILQRGAWDITNDIIEPNRIQAITTSQLFWHKNLNIGSIILHTAAGNISFQLGNFDQIKHFVNVWLYELERSDSNWM